MEEETKTNQRHDKMFIFLSAFCALVFAFTLVMNFAGEQIPGVFINTTGENADYLYLEIGLIGWAFNIWPIIYVWQFLWLFYAIISICRKNDFGPVYLNPPVLTSFILAMFALGLACNVSWLIVFSRQFLPAAFAIIFLYSVSMYILLISSHWNVNKYLPSMKKYHKWDLFWNRALVQNGVAFNATWVSIATLLNMANVIAYTARATDQSTASTIALSVLACGVLCYFVLENFILERYLRYTYSVWPVVIWALSASIAKNWDPSKTNSIITVVLLGLSIVLYLIKIVLSLWRARTKPL